MGKNVDDVHTGHPLPEICYTNFTNKTDGILSDGLRLHLQTQPPNPDFVVNYYDDPSMGRQSHLPIEP
jgi:hypothetical protein